MTLPPGWAETKLAALASKIGSGATPKGGRESYGRVGIPFIRSMNVHFEGFSTKGLAFIDECQAKALDNVEVQGGDVLLNITGASIGRVCVAPTAMSGARVNQHVCIIRCEDILPDYLCAFLAAPAMQQFILEANYGFTRQALTKGMIEAIDIPFPPAAEQRRIVRKLEVLRAHLARARAELDRVAPLVERNRARILDYAFGRPINLTELDRVATRITKGSSPRWQGFEYTSSGVLFIRSQNVLWGTTSFDDRVYLPEGFNDKAKHSVICSGDVLLNIVGASIGRAAVASKDLGGANCNQAVAIIRPCDPDDAAYLMYFLLSPIAQTMIKDGTVDVARANFSLAQIRSLQLPWPKKSAREAIVRYIQGRFTELDHLTQEAGRARALLRRLDSAILTRAFRGELVLQDSGEEPVSVLLERIRARRATVSVRKRSRHVAPAET